MPHLRSDKEGKLSAERLRELYHYDPASGLFFHRTTRNGAVAKGSVAGSRHTKTAVLIGITKRVYVAHRLAWLYTHGVWPAGVVDHINGNPRDNRIVNLRDCSQSDNIFNRRRGRISASGVRGVYYKRNGWEASIKKAGKHYHLGRFRSFDAAVAARKSAEARFFDRIPEIVPYFDSALPDPRTFVTIEPRPPLTAERLRAQLAYDPETGALSRRRAFGLAKVGKPIGNSDRDGYLHAKVDGKSYAVHRLVWLWVYGEWPPNEVHHVNHNPSDNRLVNLRGATRSENVSSARRMSRMVSRFRGVHQNGNHWQAVIHKDGIRHGLGTYQTQEEAHAVYREAAVRLHGEFASFE